MLCFVSPSFLWFDMKFYVSPNKQLVRLLHSSVLLEVYMEVDLYANSPKACTSLHQLNQKIHVGFFLRSMKQFEYNLLQKEPLQQLHGNDRDRSSGSPSISHWEQLFTRSWRAMIPSTRKIKLLTISKRELRTEKLSILKRSMSGVFV